MEIDVLIDERVEAEKERGGIATMILWTVDLEIFATREIISVWISVGRSSSLKRGLFLAIVIF